MSIYLDTSAVVPLLIREASSEVCQQAWDASDDAITSRLTYVETAAALAQARRSQRMTAGQHDASLTRFEALWSQCDVLELDEALAVRAASIARIQGLRGYDAVHCASALRVRDEDLVAVSGDRNLLEAWAFLGVDTLDTNA